MPPAALSEGAVHRHHREVILLLALCVVLVILMTYVGIRLGRESCRLEQVQHGGHAHPVLGHEVGVDGHVAVG
jgi:hypothetical protein